MSFTYTRVANITHRYSKEDRSSKISAGKVAISLTKKVLQYYVGLQLSNICMREQATFRDWSWTTSDTNDGQVKRTWYIQSTYGQRCKRKTNLLRRLNIIFLRLRVHWESVASVLRDISTAGVKEEVRAEVRKHDFSSGTRMVLASLSTLGKELTGGIIILRSPALHMTFLYPYTVVLPRTETGDT